MAAEPFPIHEAARTGDVAAIEALVRAGAEDLDEPDNTGWTPLHWAAYGGREAAIETLVRLGSRTLDTTDDEGFTPIYLATEMGHAGAIEALVRLGSKAIDVSSEEGKTPLLLATDDGRADIVELLVRMGSRAIDTPAKSHACWSTPMHSAAKSGNLQMIEILVRLGSQVLNQSRVDEDTPMQVALRECGWVEKVKTARLLEALGNRIPVEEYTSQMLQVMLGKTPPLTEDEVLEVRYRVYFADSLTYRLLPNL